MLCYRKISLHTTSAHVANWYTIVLANRKKTETSTAPHFSKVTAAEWVRWPSHDFMDMHMARAAPAHLDKHAVRYFN